MVWMKADGHVDVPQVMHRAMLALGCDQVDDGSGKSCAAPDCRFPHRAFPASIDHSMWWYQDIDINETAFVCAGYALSPRTGADSP